MKILIDGDACPVKAEAITLGQSYHWPIVIVTSIDHYSSKTNLEGVSTVYVDAGPDAADYKIVALTERDDIVITQDYGLASLVINKAEVIHHSGLRYSQENINRLLMQRYQGQQARKAGQKTKGPKAFTAADRHYFTSQLEKLILDLERRHTND